MPEKLPAFTQSAAFAVGEEQRLRGDTNCHSKSITVPVTVVLGLGAAANGLGPEP